MKIYIPTGKAISLKNVSNTIAKVLSRNGIIGLVSEQFQPRLLINRRVDGILFNYPADPVFSREYVSYYATFKSMFLDKMLFYTTIEGKPKRTEILAPVFSYVDFVANSQYTRRKLEESGLNVIATVPHGVDFDDINYAKRYAKSLRERNKKLSNGKVIFGYVGSTHIRKNVNGLIQAVQILNQKGIKDFVLEMITERVITPPNVYKVADMGTKSYMDVLAFIGSVDFLIFPTMSEGFGLPVLEGMAMGKIVLHANIPPLNEFSDPTNNLTWEYDEIEEYEPQEISAGGIIFELHKFKPEKIADAMLEAIDMFRNRKDEYEMRCEKNIEIAKRYDANITYKYFVDYFKK